MRDERGCAKSSRVEPWKVDDALPTSSACKCGRSSASKSRFAASKANGRLSQNRPLTDREGVITGFKEAGEAGEVLAQLVQERAKDLK
jgi:transcriptional regulator